MCFLTISALIYKLELKAQPKNQHKVVVHE